jgi:hypothetical protein
LQQGVDEEQETLLPRQLTQALGPQLVPPAAQAMPH